LSFWNYRGKGKKVRRCRKKPSKLHTSFGSKPAESNNIILFTGPKNWRHRSSITRSGKRNILHICFHFFSSWCSEY